MDRKRWQSIVHSSIAPVEQNCIKKYQAAHIRRHTPTIDGHKCNPSVDYATYTMDLKCINTPAALNHFSVNITCKGLPM